MSGLHLSQRYKDWQFIQGNEQGSNTSGDLISRQAVEEIINDIRDCISVEGYCAILERLKKLPPVNPQEPKYCDRNICISNEYNGIGCDECEVTKSQEPKTGHWTHEYRGQSNHICSDCHFESSRRWNYCPNCGARMENEEV